MRQVDEVAAAWSLLYSALYLLDKIEDDELDQLAFHPPAGTLTNITTGLLATVELILDELDLPGRSGEDLAEIRGAFHRCLVTMCAGQSLDLSGSRLSLEQSWSVAEAKSGVFFGLGCRLGAFAACGDRQTAEKFYQYGHALGMLVQIEDDLDGLWGKPNKRSDLAQGKFSLPVAFAVSTGSEEWVAELLALLAQARMDYNAEESARGMVLKQGALLYLLLEAEKQKQAAETALENLSLDHAARETLLKLIDRPDVKRYQGK